MRLRNLKNAKEIIESSKNYKLKIEKDSFNNNNPIHLEIGIGKGTFIYEMAKKYPNINFIGIDKYDTLIAHTINKINDLPNVLLLKGDAIDLEELLNVKVNVIYLNFSDPWPKTRHIKRRLTYKDYIKIYKNISEDLNIYLKTDNINLFEYSLESLSKDFYFEKVILDLHNSNEFNVKTEYEVKFSNKGFKINYLHAKHK